MSSKPFFSTFLQFCPYKKYSPYQSLLPYNKSNPQILISQALKSRFARVHLCQLSYDLTMIVLEAQALKNLFPTLPFQEVVSSCEESPLLEALSEEFFIFQLSDKEMSEQPIFFKNFSENNAQEEKDLFALENAELEDLAISKFCKKFRQFQHMSLLYVGQFPLEVCS